MQTQHERIRSIKLALHVRKILADKVSSHERKAKAAKLYDLCKENGRGNRLYIAMMTGRFRGTTLDEHGLWKVDGLSTAKGTRELVATRGEYARYWRVLF